MKFVRKPHAVDAVQVTTDPQHAAQNRIDVEAVAHGRANPGSQNPNAFVVEVPTGAEMARPGDWIVRHAGGTLEVLETALFKADYEPAAIETRGPARKPTHDEIAARAASIAVTRSQQNLPPDAVADWTDAEAELTREQA